ncbi:BrnA antitoxin family protein [Kovacikia minuta CCNUW1]|uniref:CopG family antitoxin n=1 Tax=Kovacikia minuta TaxID=2931930 RepID=UPI001CCFE34A|nr:CopG family antitoxin [Kovacikia minuta]UBF26937.1 BrnA antitoxin family protein [Kovacikia minuta CCNUW1]
MAESETEKLPQFNSHQEVVEFFDTHDMGEYESELPEAFFDIDLKRNQYLVSVDGYLMGKILEVAKERQVSVEVLLDSWLKEKLLKAS